MTRYVILRNTTCAVCSCGRFQCFSHLPQACFSGRRGRDGELDLHELADQTIVPNLYASTPVQKSITLKFFDLPFLDEWCNENRSQRLKMHARSLSTDAFCAARVETYPIDAVVCKIKYCRWLNGMARSTSRRCTHLASLPSATWLR